MTGSHQLTELPSGIRLVTETVPGALSVSTGVWVGVGARDETIEQSGVSHFLEHLLFKGTETRSARSISEAIDRVGGDMNAFTSKEVTAYYTRLPAMAWKLGVEILGDVLTAPALRASDVEIERDVILEELGMDEDAHEDRVMTLLAESLFPDHPLGRETAGEKATVEALSPETVREFFQRFYHPSNMVIAMAGAVDHDAAVEQVARCFTAPKADGPVHRAAPALPIRPLASVKRRIEQVHVAIGLAGVDRDDPDREALDVVVQVLGGGPSSRLFDEIREQRGLAYSVYSGSVSYSDAGAVSVYAATSPAQADTVLRLMVDELDRMASSGVTADELEIAKGFLTGSFMLGLEDTASRMSRMGGHVTARGSVRPIADQLERFAAVTAADVQRVAARIFNGPRSLAAVGPVSKSLLSSWR